MHLLWWIQAGASSKIQLDYNWESQCQPWKNQFLFCGTWKKTDGCVGCLEYLLYIVYISLPLDIHVYIFSAFLLHICKLYNFIPVYWNKSKKFNWADIESVQSY